MVNIAAILRKRKNKEMNKERGILLVTALVLIMSAMSGCARPELYGKPITEDKVTAIGSILTRPKDYEGETVLVKGEIAVECPTGCWINLKDDSGLIYVDFNPSAFAIPQKVRHNITVQGKVKLRSGKPMIIGTGVEIR